MASGRMRRPEEALQRAIVEHLHVRGVPGLVFWHTPNGGGRSKAESGILKAMGVRPGVSDLILVHRGKIFALELKAEGGRASEAQMKFLSDIDHAGAFTAMPTGLDAALATLEAWGLLKPNLTLKSVLIAAAERLETAK